MSHLAIISGGHRPTGESPRIARWFQAQVQAASHSTYLLDLSTAGLPLWDEGLWGKEGLAGKWQTLWSPISEQLQKAEGFIIVTPEYHGTAPAALMNFLLIAGQKELGHKPALLASVSAGINGAYPISQLLAFGHKNNRLVYLPEHLIIRHAPGMLVDNPPAEHAPIDKTLRERIAFVLPQLYAYTEVLKSVRANVATISPQFPSGM